MSEHYMDNESVLHIYGQAFWHEPAVIAGNVAGLTALRDAIDRALNGGTDFKAVAEVSAVDGEGYAVLVFNEHAADTASRKLPYTDRLFKELDEARNSTPTTDE